MITITWIGHHRVIHAGLGEDILQLLEERTARHAAVTFLTGSMGEFDGLCNGCATKLKKAHPEKQIRVSLVIPYFTKELTKYREYYEEAYDEILFPECLEGVHYKAAIPKRNRWMVDQADLLLSYVKYEQGGACQTLRYAIRKPGLTIIDCTKFEPHPPQIRIYSPENPPT